MKLNRWIVLGFLIILFGINIEAHARVYPASFLKYALNRYEEYHAISNKDERIIAALASLGEGDFERAYVLSQFMAAAHEEKPPTRYYGRNKWSRRLGVNGGETLVKGGHHEELLEALGPGKVFVDIGSATGFMTTLALEAGARVYALDRDARNLLTLLEEIDDRHIDRLMVGLGTFPEDFSENEILQGLEGSVDAIALVHVIHFMKPQQIIRTYEWCAKLLKGGARLVVAFRLVEQYPEFRQQLESLLPEALKDLAQGRWSFPSYFLKEVGFAHPHHALVVKAQLQLAGLAPYHSTRIQTGISFLGEMQDIEECEIERFNDPSLPIGEHNTVYARKGPSCRVCSKSAKLRCSRCHKTRYCSSECQKIHWKDHKSNCGLSKI